jgi:uncharacterized protein (TIGR02246 family)
MKTSGFRTRILVFAMALAPVAAVAEDGSKAVDEAWLKGMKANDVEAVVACYAPDAVMWLPGAPEARGTKAIRDTYAGLLSSFTVADVTITNAMYQTSGDLSAAWGNFTMTLQPKDGGSPVVQKGRFTSASKKIGGKWVYVADHASDDPPPASTKP